MDSEEKRLSSAETQKKCRCKKLPTCCDPPSKLEIGVVVGSLVSYAIVFIVGMAYSSATDMFNENRSNQTTGYAPPSWAFGIWGFIYTWSFVFVAYSIAALFPKTGLHRAPVAIYPIYAVTNLCATLWMVFAEQYLYWPGLFAITGMPVTLYICLFLSIRRSRQHGLHTHHDGRKYYLYTYLVENALAMCMGWVSVAYLLYLGVTLIYGHGLDMTDVGTGILSWLLIKLAIFLSLELTVLDKYMRHIWAHYLSLMTAVTGSIIRNYDPNNRNSFISVCLAGALGAAFLVKMSRIVTGKCGRPEYDSRVGPAPADSQASLGASSLPEKVDMS